jgi:hypothetical protein
MEKETKFWELLLKQRTDLMLQIFKALSRAYILHVYMYMFIHSIYSLIHTVVLFHTQVINLILMLTFSSVTGYLLGELCSTYSINSLYASFIIFCVHFQPVENMYGKI